MRAARIVLKFMLIYSLAFTAVYLIPEFVHRRAFDQALMAWYRNPTQENEVTLQREQGINQTIKLKDSAAGGATLAFVGYGVYVIIHRRKKRQ